MKWVVYNLIYTSLVAQLIKNRLQDRRPQFDSRVRKFPWRRDRLSTSVFLGFPGCSAGKEFACNAGALGFIPGSGRCPEEGMATHSSILAWRDRAAWWATVEGVAKSHIQLSNYAQHNNLIYTHIHTLINMYICIHSTILLQNLFLNIMIIHKEQIFQHWECLK